MSGPIVLNAIHQKMTTTYHPQSIYSLFASPFLSKQHQSYPRHKSTPSSFVGRNDMPSIVEVSIDISSLVALPFYTVVRSYIDDNEIESFSRHFVDVVEYERVIHHAWLFDTDVSPEKLCNRIEFESLQHIFEYNILSNIVEEW